MPMPSTMRGERSGPMHTSCNGHVVDTVGHFAGDTLVLPSTTVVGKGIGASLAFDHIPMQQQRIVDADTIES